MRRIMCAVLASLSSVTFLPTQAGAASLPATKPVAGAPSHVQRAIVHKVRPMPILTRVAALARVSISQLRAEWQHVAVCEVGGNWSMHGPAYSGIGFANSTWLEYGGSRFAPHAGAAPRDVQILIGMKITGGWVPDQNGCSPFGW